MHLTSSYIILAFVICRFPYISITSHLEAMRSRWVKMGLATTTTSSLELKWPLISKSKNQQRRGMTRMTGVLGEWMNEWMNEWMDGWMDGRMNEWMNEWMHARTHACMHGWMDGWMNEWMNEWMNDDDDSFPSLSALMPAEVFLDLIFSASYCGQIFLNFGYPVCLCCLYKHQVSGRRRSCNTSLACWFVGDSETSNLQNCVHFGWRNWMETFQFSWTVQKVRIILHSLENWQMSNTPSARAFGTLAQDLREMAGMAFGSLLLGHPQWS